MTDHRPDTDLYAHMLRTHPGSLEESCEDWRGEHAAMIFESHNATPGETYFKEDIGARRRRVFFALTDEWRTTDEIASELRMTERQVHSDLEWMTERAMIERGYDRKEVKYVRITDRRLVYRRRQHK